MLLTNQRLLILLRTLAIVLGAGNTGAAIAEQAMGHDGINYLDEGDAWLRGDWATAVNGTWSPLYPILVGTVLRVVDPSIVLEFPLVHAVNFALYIGALLAFEHLWKNVAARYYGSEEGDNLLPRWAFTSIGYALFIWSSVCLVRVFVVTPDMLFMITMFLAFALLLRLTSGGATRWTAGLFGLALGAGFLSKGFAWPILAIMWLGGAGMMMRSGRSGHALAAAAGLAIVAGPFIGALSKEAGRFTLGDAGRILYLKQVLRAPHPLYRGGSPDVDGEPLHSMAIAATTPPVIRYDANMPVTYPVSYDQGYWYAGLGPTLRPVRQWEAVATNLQYYFVLFVRLQGISLAALAALLIVRGRRPIAPDSRWSGTLALAAIAFYALVYVEGRYVAPFIVVLWAAGLLSVRFPAAPNHPAWLRASSIVMLAGFAINIGAFHLDGLNAMVGVAPVSVAGPVSANDTGSDKPTDVALALRRTGLEAGDRIGVIGDAIHASWARLARLRIVAEIAPADAAAFWKASAEDRAAVLQAFDAAGVRAVIAQAPSPGVPLQGWTRLGDTSFYVSLRTAVTTPFPDANR